jgi:hypothetical protein
MPLKWKIFRIANYLLLLLSLACTAFIIYFFARIGNRSAADIGYFIVFVLGGTMLIANYAFNINLLERYYPDGELNRITQIWMTVVLVSCCFIIGGLTLLWLVDISDMLNEPPPNDIFFSRPRVVVMLVGMILLIAYYVFWMQVALRKTIQRNRRAIYSAFLDSN